MHFCTTLLNRIPTSLQTVLYCTLHPLDVEYLEKPGQDWALTKAIQRVMGRCACGSTGQKHSYPGPAAAHFAPCSSEDVPSRMKVDGGIGSILCSPCPERVSPHSCPAADSWGGTSPPWNCFRVGCAQEVTKATNFQLEETGWEKSPDGVVPSMGKSQELSGCKGSSQNECWVKCTGRWVISSREPVPCLPGEQGQQWAGACAAAAVAPLLPLVWDSCPYLSRSVGCQHWTALMSHRWHRSPPSCWFASGMT